MYFDFEDHRPDTPTLPRSLTRLEAVLLTVVVYLSLVIFVLVAPNLPWVREWEAQRRQALAEQQKLALERQRENARFVYVAPRVDMKALRPPDRADLSDIDRKARTVERAPKPLNDMPFARGNSPERVESTPVEPERAAAAPQPDPSAAEEQRRSGVALPESMTAIQPKAADAPQTARGQSLGVIADAIRNVQKYAPRDSYVNLQGGGEQLAPSIQFDTKGVEFGPWLRRFIAQIRRNWFIPMAAMTLRGHVAVTFFVGKDGRISELKVLRPSGIDAFNNSAFNALAASNPTHPLPPEYPDDRAFFTVTFYFNETPGQ
jgi:TonB family protein